MVSLAVQHAGVLARLDVEPGQRVAAGVALAQVAASPAVVAQYRQALAALRLARAERTHVAQLRAQHLATTDQLGRADKAVTDALSALDALRHEGGTAPTETVRAPFPGVVTAIAVTQGQAVAAGAPLIALSRSGALLVTVGIPPAQAGQVHPGATARLTPLDGGATLAGRVVGVGGMLNPATHLVDAVIAPAAGDPLSGAAYRATIRTGWFQGWIVPRDAVLTDARGAFVYQVGPHGAARVPVRVVGEQGARTAVRGKIAPSLPLVVSGNYQLTPGMAVRTAP